MLIDLALKYSNVLDDTVNLGFEWMMCPVNLYMGFIVAHRMITTILCVIIISSIIATAMRMAIKPKD